MTEYNSRKEDTYWIVEEIRPYILKYLQEKFPDSILEREFDQVDIMIHGPRIPVEIQKTSVKKACVAISTFEDLIRRQIEQNIMTFEQCWLFIDAKFLYHLQNNLNRHTSINMDWLYQFFKTEKVRVFAITINGIVRELEDKDFEFIRKFSNTCKLSNEDEHRILARNKSKIAYNVYKGHGFTTEELKKLYDEYEKDSIRPKSFEFQRWLEGKEGRYKELGVIKRAIGMLSQINDMLKCNMKDRHAVQYASTLGITEGNKNGSGGDMKFSRMRCDDNYTILEHFPGYFEKKELWDFWRTHTVAHNTFMTVVRGEYPNYLKDYNIQRRIDDPWG